MKRSQTATEYLIILAVVIVIALVVASLMGGFPGMGSGTGKKVSDLKLSSDTIGVESYSIGTDSSLFKIKNNYYDTVTVISFRVNNQSNLTCNSSNTIPALPIVLDVGQSKLINCSVVNSSTYTLSNKQTPTVGIIYTDNLGATRTAGNEGSGAVTSNTGGEQGGGEQGGSLSAMTMTPLATESSGSGLQTNSGVTIGMNVSIAQEVD